MSKVFRLKDEMDYDALQKFSYCKIERVEKRQNIDQ